MKKTRIKIVGATGYGGVGILELLLRHDYASVECLVAIQDVGKTISQVYPHLEGFCDLDVVAPDSPQAEQPCDLVFFSTPDGVGMQQADAELARGARVIDYSGDFRFNTEEAYADYAQRLNKDPSHKTPNLLPKSIYGLPELHRDDINHDIQLVGNPGCFAISCILGLAPAARHHLVDFSSIICDCKTGVSGAGKKPSATFHYPSRYEQMNAYRLSGHQHVCEIERELSLQAGSDIQVTFTAQVVPTCRGIMSCLYGTLSDSISAQDIMKTYRDFYSGNPFIRVLEADAPAGTHFVRGTNYCNLVVSVDERTRRMRIVSYIDNLMKGQAGNALQNMNLMFGYPETMGLEYPGQYP